MNIFFFLFLFLFFCFHNAFSAPAKSNKEPSSSLNSQQTSSLNIRTCALQNNVDREEGVRHSIISDRENLMGGELSDYWAQELIGSDLLREELKKTPAPDRENWIAIFDDRMANHNISVQNLISDEGKHAVLPDLEEETLSFLDTLSVEGYKSALSLYETRYPGDYLFGLVPQRPPHYINNSMGWDKSKDIYEVFQQLAFNKTSTPIIISISGNHFPNRLEDIKTQASKDFDVIVVGSFSPFGFVSDFSQSGEELAILAPSDFWLTSAGEDGEYEPFGGTSGAAPLVTGSLAGFEWLSGYHPTAKEAKVLLEKTAIPTLHSHEKPRINGAGLLNAYKLGEVAKRLKEKCEGESISCFKEEILRDENYRFPEDKGLKSEVERVFPSCGDSVASVLSTSIPLGDDFSETSLPVPLGSPASNSVLFPPARYKCEEKNQLFNRLRRAIFLNPERSKDLLTSLRCIYEEGGFFANAEVLDKLIMALGTEEEVREYVSAALREEEDKENNALRLALGMGGFEDQLTLSQWKRGSHFVEGVAFLEKAFATGNLDLQLLALKSARWVGEPALSLLQAGFATGNRELQWAVLESAGYIGEPALPLLQEAFATGNQKFQLLVLYLAEDIGEPALPLLKEMLESQHVSESVKEQIRGVIFRLESD